MESMMGLINLEHEHDFLNELTYFRCGAAVPFAGRYRLIDFTLSNMVRSDVQDIAIFTRNKYRSLMDHLGTGADWELDRRHGGLFILPPDWNDPTDISKGDLSHFHNNRDYFNRGKSNYVIISGSQYLSNADYKDAFDYHLERGADVTLITTRVKELGPEHEPCQRIVQDDQGWVSDITNELNNTNVYTGVYIISKSLLMELVDECIAHHKDHFFLHGIKDNLERLNIQTFEHTGYSAFINSVESFYRNNMNLLNPENYKELFYQNSFIKTKISNEPPTKYNDISEVKDSLLANGCEINGEVENSILFRGVKVKPGAKVINSVIMQRCTIEEGVHLENVILDKDVTVTEGQTFIGSHEKPFVVAKRKVMS
ncbi:MULTISPECIES: glucose-1-phosphate adenylyltransferase subunit GlgD [Alteribacter]|uniref:Glucose-1-phosphate adenylyltransferase subunit GlgD n=1 Tax=Alteribacter keqinensis TaxID=2483800 RepID=A0A3M7TYP6_9BACI|nr:MULTISPECIES: glucose-1-phosphate adenylyltransferase subunit GlgD [Alteribacter]MBM7096378.1 glucose-1-phosphate adenylyltransferase subunit GlgD [Alteribacter salitolerans]RNA70401.1 glucose-1-phosphate adenylyltransferase subunit GlgD [Alteribacter keqinensis]